MRRYTKLDQHLSLQRDLPGALEFWEGDVRNYQDATGAPVHGPLKSTALKRMLPGRVRIMVQTTNDNVYDKVKKVCARTGPRHEDQDGERWGGHFGFRSE